MTPWLEVAVIAFFAQLAVLPGEKVQLIIAGLSTRYDPLLVVSAAGTAFAGWTALEVLFGAYVQRVLPGLVLDLGTGLLFFVFAVMLVRSAPDERGGNATTDGGPVAAAEGELDVRVPLVGWRVPALRGGFLPIFALMAFGEFGDKTQLVTIGLAARYAHPTAIWAGEMAAILPVSLLNAYVFFTFADRFDVRRLHLASAALFAFFGIDTLQALLTGVSVWELVVELVAGLVIAG